LLDNAIIVDCNCKGARINIDTNGNICFFNGKLFSQASDDKPSLFFPNDPELSTFVTNIQETFESSVSAVLFNGNGETPTKHSNNCNEITSLSVGELAASWDVEPYWWMSKLSGIIT
jgi:hypothetical protein